MLKDILKILENDARATPKQIAAMTGMPQTEVVKLIKKAQDDRTILKYKAIVNWDKAENEHVLAWIGVKLEPQKDVGLILLRSIFIAFRRRGAFILFPARSTCWSWYR